MQKKRRKLCLLTILLVSIFCMTGCEIQVFEEEESPYAIVDVDVENLIPDTFYIKDGTKFHSVITPERNFNGTPLTVDASRVLWTFGDEESIPTLYKDEVIAYASTSTSKMDGIVIERFKDMGYSFGFYNAYFDKDGNLCFNGQNSVPQSNTYTKFANNSNLVRIETINGQEVTSDMVSYSGAIVGLEAFGKYEMSYYIGTYYKEEVWNANSHIFQSYELFVADNIEQTKNGYLQIKLPEDLKSGYYLINGFGMFKYINQNKSEVEDISLIDMNEPYSYSQSQGSSNTTTVQEFGVFINEKKANMTFMVTYEPSTKILPEGVLISPTGQEYPMENDYKSTLSCSLTEVSQGEWTIKVSPYSIVVKNVTCTKTVAETEDVIEVMQEASATVEVEKGETDRLLKVEFIGSYPASAFVEAPDGKSYQLTRLEDNIIGYHFAYAREGTYEVKVYYKEDFKIEKAYMYDNSNYETEFITITQ